MDRRKLGSTNLAISELVFGGVSLGVASSSEGFAMSDVDAQRTLDMAFDAGINTFDTANMYSDGMSEEVLGHWISKRRTDVVVLTKCRFATHGFRASDPSPPEFGLSRSAILHACEGSLRRLRTEYIDLLQLHMQHRQVAIEETLRALDDLIRSGKVRYIGCSNYSAYRLMEALWVADKNQLPRIASVQLPWSLIMREVERELVPLCVEFGLGTLVYSPLGRGFLSGKYARGEPPPADSRLANRRSVFNDYDQARMWSVLAAVKEMAARYHTSPAAVAIAWGRSKPSVAGVIIGIRNKAQLRENLAGASLTLSNDDLAKLDRVSEPLWGYPYSLIARYEPW
jgi:aryl-alcohol dehydrogenase-like predicted oxidoreductase